MKTSFTIGILFVLGIFSSNAHAAEENSTTTISLQVMTSCRITSTENINFGNYDPLGVHATVGGVAQGRISVVCTSGTNNVSVSLYQGANAQEGSTCSDPRRAMRSSGGGALAYAIYQDLARTRPWGCSDPSRAMLPLFDQSLQPVSLTTYGFLPPGQDAMLGQYRDTVEVSVTF